MAQIHCNQHNDLLSETEFKLIESRMYPGGYSESGFLGYNYWLFSERLIDVIEKDNAYLKSVSITHNQIADALDYIIDGYQNFYKQNWKIRFYQPELIIDDMYIVKPVSYMGAQKCPFQNENLDPKYHGHDYGDTDVTIKNIKTGQELSFNTLLPHMIRCHQFFEGSKCKHRLEPSRVIEMFCLKPGVDTPIAKDIKMYKSSVDRFLLERFAEDNRIFSNALTLGALKPVLPGPNGMLYYAKANDYPIDVIDTSNYDPTRNIQLKYFSDTSPKNDSYFIKHNEDPCGIAAELSIFNEDSTDVQQTLNSLYDAWCYLKSKTKDWETRPLNVCLIQDGWYNASASTKEYLKVMFPKEIDNGVQGSNYWWDHYDDFNYTDDVANHPDRTFIFQKSNDGLVKINPQRIFADDNKFMNITLIIKIKNRRKHNSHEWFTGVNGYVDAVNPEYLYFMDAFTLLHKSVLYRLVNKLDKSPNIVGATGRQRLMSMKQSDGVVTYTL